MKKVKRIEGYPFFDHEGRASVCMSNDKDTITYVYKDLEDNEYYTNTIPKEAIPDSNSDVFKTFSLHAELIELDISIDIFGGRQRKEDMLGSVLQVTHYKRVSPLQYGVTLRSERRDGVSIKMISEELKFIFPTILTYKKVNKQLPSTEDIVIAIKDSSFNMFNKGDEFTVTKVSKHEFMESLNLLHLKSKKSEFVAYLKYFKLKKDGI